jgi:hypothetical protein
LGVGEECQCDTWLYRFSSSGHEDQEGWGCVCEGNHRFGDQHGVGIVPGMKGERETSKGKVAERIIISHYTCIEAAVYV